MLARLFGSRTVAAEAAAETAREAAAAEERFAVDRAKDLVPRELRDPG